jgi:hypothetical protein
MLALICTLTIRLIAGSNVKPPVESRKMLRRLRRSENTSLWARRGVEGWRVGGGEGGANVREVAAQAHRPGAHRHPSLGTQAVLWHTGTSGKGLYL